MKAVVIKNLEMPTGEGTFVDARIYSDGKVLLPCSDGNCSEVEAEEIEIQDEI